VGAAEREATNAFASATPDASFAAVVGVASAFAEPLVFDELPHPTATSPAMATTATPAQGRSLPRSTWFIRPLPFVVRLSMLPGRCRPVRRAAALDRGDSPMIRFRTGRRIRGAVQKPARR